MKLSKSIIIVLFAAFCIIGCKPNNQIANANDYDKYLKNEPNKSLTFVKKEIVFWNDKFLKAPNQISYLSQLAANYSKSFEITGNIDYLIKTEKLLLQSNQAYNYTNAGTIRSLARNYISQHRFKEANQLAQKAFEIGDGMKETQKLMFDVNMELGNYDVAEKALNEINLPNDFDFFIRMSKWCDHQGDLNKAIQFLEKAKNEAEINDNKSLKIWTYSNLGDLNGHAGNIKKSYDYYLKTLELDAYNSYALKGIAWITFSNDKNTKEAKRIITAIEVSHNTPDFYLLKSKIADFENNNIEKQENLNQYFKMISNNKYGAMYNKYNTLIYAENKETLNKALQIAKIEVDHRPTPDSYDLLAWAYYKLGNSKKALEIAQENVIGKSFEPILNYHVAEIYKINNRSEVSQKIKKELQQSVFELGPNYITKINKL